MSGSQTSMSVEKPTSCGAMPTTVVRRALDADGAAEERPVAAEAAPPEPLAQDRDGGASRAVLGGAEGAAGDQRQAQDLEEVGRHRQAVEALRAALAAQVDADLAQAGESREAARLLLPGEEVGVRDRELVDAAGEVRLGEEDDPLRLGGRGGGRAARRGRG